MNKEQAINILLDYANKKEVSNSDHHNYLQIGKGAFQTLNNGD